MDPVLKSRIAPIPRPLGTRRKNERGLEGLVFTLDTEVQDELTGVVASRLEISPPGPATRPRPGPNPGDPQGAGAGLGRRNSRNTPDPGTAHPAMSDANPTHTHSGQSGRHGLTLENRSDRGRSLRPDPEDPRPNPHRGRRRGNEMNPERKLPQLADRSCGQKCRGPGPDKPHHLLEGINGRRGIQAPINT